MQIHRQKANIMENAIDRVRTLRVADVMNKNVVQVSANQTMAEVAAVFAKHNISAAPVADDQGRCVGILSATDFLKRNCSAATEAQTVGEFDSDGHKLEQPTGDQPMHIVPVAEDKASSYMTQGIQSIAPDASMAKAAMMMCAEHIHRLPAIDENGRVVGMISTMDIVAAMLNAMEESDQSFLNEYVN